MTKTLTGYDVMVYVKDILNNVIFTFKIERKMIHNHDMTYGLCMFMKVSCQSYEHPFK